MIRCREILAVADRGDGTGQVVDFDHVYQDAESCAAAAARRFDDREMRGAGLTDREMGGRERWVEVTGFGRDPAAVYRFRVVTGLVRVYDVREGGRVL